MPEQVDNQNSTVLLLFLFHLSDFVVFTFWSLVTKHSADAVLSVPRLPASLTLLVTLLSEIF